jgi:hypothetical protein
VGLSDNLKWEAGQPDNKGGREECLHIRFVQNVTGTILTDRNCTAKYIFACEVSKNEVVRFDENLIFRAHLVDRLYPPATPSVLPIYKEMLIIYC